MLRKMSDYEVLDGNTPAMLKVSTACFAKFFKAIPFVSAVGIFQDIMHTEEGCDNHINLAVFLHNPPVMVRKPEAFWDPCGTGEWMIYGDYDIYGLFGKNFLEKLGEYSGELPITYNPNLTVLIFDELVVSDPAYRAREWRNWKSRKFIKHVFKTLKFWNEVKQAFLPDRKWEQAVFDNNLYHWIWHNGSLLPTRRKPKFVGKSDRFFDKTYHKTSYCAKAKPWEEAGIMNEASAQKQGFERCKNCLPKLETDE